MDQTIPLVGAFELQRACHRFFIQKDQLR